MRRFVAFCWFVMMGMPGFGQGLLRLEQVRPGATVIVETTDQWGGAEFDRCKLISVEAVALTCVDVMGLQGREVFPVRQLDAVYEIHKSHAGLVWALIGLAAVAGLLAATAATGNIGFLLIAALGGIIVGGFATGELPGRRGPFGGVYAAAPQQPWEKGESGRLVYVRRWGGP